jgi:hypothetical protein
MDCRDDIVCERKSLLYIYLLGFNHIGNDVENGSKDDIFREDQTNLDSIYLSLWF